jgi:hypothetical protein
MRFTRFARPLVAGIVAVAAAGALAQAAQAHPREPVVPAAIKVPEGNKLFLVGHAVGVQIYSCNAAPAGGFAWGFVAPRANLVDDHGRLIITHFAGPTWQARDGSLLVGKLVNSATVDPTAIPWLLLAKASTVPGQYGDRLVRTTYIQRIATRGGLAPAAALCNATAVGTVKEVPYTADYFFWKQSHGHRHDRSEDDLEA